MQAMHIFQGNEEAELFLDETGTETELVATRKVPSKPFSLMRLVQPLMGILVILFAAVLVGKALDDIEMREVVMAYEAIPLEATLLASLFTAISFGAMALYDVIAARGVIPRRVSGWLAGFAGAAGFALSNTVGFHLILGGAIRYRVYRSAAVSAPDVARIVAVVFGSLSMVMAAVIGAALALDPAGLPLPWQMPTALSQAAGLLAMGTVAGMIGWLWKADRSLSLFGWQMALPRGRSVLALTGVGLVDVLATALALYVLMPADLVPSLPCFLVILLLALLAGSVSHVPGGLGVVEATVLVGIGATDRPDAVAALVLFRLVYYFVPFVLAAAGLFLFETCRANSPISKAGRTAMKTAQPYAAPILAVLVFVGGTLLLLSGSMPPMPDRIAILRAVAPLPVVEIAHLLGSLSGMGLLILARGLANRGSMARNAAITLLLSGAVFALLQGLNWKEALLLTGLAMTLMLFRDAFRRRGSLASLRLSPPWMVAVVLIVAAVTLTGFLEFQNAEFSQDLWWQFTWHGAGSRFLRATFVVTVVAATIGVDAVMNRPMLLRPGKAEMPDVVREILDASPNALAQVAYLGDKKFLVAEDGSAFLMYGVSGRSVIVLGEPVGDPAAGQELIERLAEMTDTSGARLVFYAVSSTALPALLDRGLAFLKTGEVARVDLRNFTMSGKARQDSRTALRRAEREGFSFSIVSKSEIPALIPELRAVSDAWLDQKHGREKGFSLGRFDPTYLAQFDCAVMRKDGEIVAFANLWRGAGKEELSVDLMRYRPNTSKVLMDALFTHMILYGQSEGYRWFNLGASPLSGLKDEPQTSLWNRVGLFIYQRGGDFYNFDGLRAFKDKFDPVWSPQFLAAPKGLSLPRGFFDATTLISGGPAALLKH